MHTDTLHDDVTIRWAADLDQGHSLTIEDRLEDLDLTAEQITGCTEIVEQEIERRSMHHCAAVLHRIFAHLAAHNTQTAALAKALGFMDEPQERLADRFGVSKQAISNLVGRLVPLLGPLSAIERKPHKDNERPPAPNGEEWLTLHEARKLAKVRSDVIQIAAREGRLRWVQVGKRSFFEEADVMRWAGEVEIERAQARLTDTPKARWKQQAYKKSLASAEPLACSA